MSEVALYNRYGKSVFRLCDKVVYDYVGKPRGHLVGKAIYDLRAQHRGFWVNNLLRDRMGRIIAYCAESNANGLPLPPIDIPPVPYKNVAAPEPPAEACDRDCPPPVSAWSIMQLENLLPIL